MDNITVYSISTATGLYDLFLFPRFHMDTGMRYALLTISRYGIFTLCVIIALSFIHLDLSHIGWLMAAVGFGLGFGMQEIFSNFELRCFIEDANNLLSTKNYLNVRINDELNTCGIEIPFPQRDIHIRRDDIKSQDYGNPAAGNTVTKMADSATYEGRRSYRPEKKSNSGRSVEAESSE